MNRPSSAPWFSYVWLCGAKWADAARHQGYREAVKANAKRSHRTHRAAGLPAVEYDSADVGSHAQQRKPKSAVPLEQRLKRGANDQRPPRTARSLERPGGQRGAPQRSRERARSTDE